MERRRVSFPIAAGTRVLFAPRLSSPLSRTHSSLAAVPDRPPTAFSTWESVGSVASGLPPHCHSRCSLARIATAAANLGRRRAHHPSWARRARRPAAPRHGATVVGTRPRDVIRDAKGRREGGKKGAFPLPAVRFALALLRPRPEEDLMHRQPASQPQPALGMADENVG